MHTRLQSARDRAQHQSLIGRNAENPLTLRTIVEPLPTQTDDTWLIRIVIENNTIGTVPIVFDPTQVIVGDQQGSSGFGLEFTPNTANLQIAGNARTNQAATSIPNDNIKLLGPRQRCVHRVTFNQSQTTPLQNGTYSIRSYYRTSVTGQVFQTTANVAPVFLDQGLNILSSGIVYSQEVEIPAVLNAQ